MHRVSDEFLLTVAEVSSALIGLFLVGIIFFVETGFRRFDQARIAVVPYFRASTKIVMVLLAFPLVLSLSLVVLDLVWNRILFAMLCVTVIAANVDTVRRVRAFSRATGSTALLINEWLGTLVVAVLVTVPWILGGFQPSREDLTWAIFLALIGGFISIAALVLSVYDVPRSEADEKGDAGTLQSEGSPRSGDTPRSEGAGVPADDHQPDGASTAPRICQPGAPNR